MALFDVPVEKYCPENFQDIKVHVHCALLYVLNLSLIKLIGLQ